MKNTLKILYLLFTIFLIFLGNSTFGQQYTLKGKVVNQTNLPIEFLNVRLLKNDTVFFNQTYTDSLGFFSFNAIKGNYIISIQQFGKEFFNKKLELTQNTDLGSIEIDEGVVLDAVKITAIRKITKESVDKTTLEIKNQQIFEGDNTISILSKMQGVVIINDRILYDGVEINSLKINNRSLNFSSQKEMMDYLKSIDNKVMKKLEIINPNAKFSASNSGKTLNIIIDQPLLDGFNFNPKINYSQGIYSDKDMSLFSQLKKNKISSNIFFSYGINKDYSDQSSIINYKDINESQVQKNELTSDIQPFNLNIDLQYDINHRTYMGVAFKYNTMKFEDNTKSIVNLYKSSIQDLIFNSKNYLNINGEYYTTSLYFNRKLDSIGQNIRLELNYNIYNTQNKQFLTNEIVNFSQNEFNQKIDRKVYLPNISLDYDKKILGDTNLSVGLLYYNMKNDENREILSGQLSEFRYSENVFAQYLSVLGQTKYFSYQIGLRGEATSNSFNNYYDLFPSLSLRKDFKKLNIQLSYNRSITRPTGYMLSPNLVYQNQYLARMGDPKLLPTMRDLISSIFSYKAWRLSVSYYNYNNSINVLQKIDNSNSRLILNQYINIKNKSQADFTLSYSYRKKNLTITPMVYYSLGSFRLEKESEKIKNDFSYFNISTSYNITKTDRIDGGFRYFFKNKQIYNTTKSRCFFDLTYNKSLMNNKLNIQFFVKDLFKGNIEKNHNILSSIENISKEYRDSRQIGLSIRYSFSSGDNIKVDGTRKNINRK